MTEQDRRGASRPASIVAFLGLGVALCLAPNGVEAQEPEIVVDHPVFAFLSDLVGHRCEIRATWPNGRPFRLDKEFAWELDGRIVTVLTSVVDDRGRREPRNHGVRAYDADADRARFWEFDRLGGITEGPVWVEDGTLHYEYFYAQAGQTLRDTWTPEGENTFAYRIRVWEDGEWGETYMDAVYRCADREAGADP